MRRPSRKAASADREPLTSSDRDLLKAAGIATSGQDLEIDDGRVPLRTALRRGRRLRRDLRDDEVVPTTIRLVREDDVLRWELPDSGLAPVSAYRSAGRRRRAGRRGVVDFTREVIETIRYAPADGSQVAHVLNAIDKHLNPRRGVYQLRNGVETNDEVDVKPGAKKKCLLLVHGTFSNSDGMVGDLKTIPEGRKLLADAEASYDQVLALEHPTLSVSPILNAMRLYRAFADKNTAIDVVCHSRGGLVVRWWLEKLRVETGRDIRVVFVGSPLQGTSLAAPHRLRHSLDMLTNVGDVLSRVAGLAAATIPWVGIMGGLIRVVTSGVKVAASTPMIDAAVGLVPGLAGQSRISNNFELAELGETSRVRPASYAFVTGNFEPAPTDGIWKFLRYFTKPKKMLVDAAADLVFDAENDLVVDTASMMELSRKPETLATGPKCHFPDSDTVHHLNYFQQPQTVKLIREHFRLA